MKPIVYCWWWSLVLRQLLLTQEALHEDNITIFKTAYVNYRYWRLVRKLDKACILSYSTVVRDHEGLGILVQNDYSQNQLDIYLLSGTFGALVRLSQAQNVFRSMLNPSIKLLWIFKNSVFDAFFYWLTYLLTNAFRLAF